jgi:hypothetical protein
MLNIGTEKVKNMMYIDKFSCRWFGFLVCFLAATSSQAAMYKWVDADGITQYTQSPPPDGISADTVAPPPKVDTEAAIKQLQEQQKRSDQYFEDKSKQQEENQNAEADAARKKEMCAKARARLASYERPRVNIVNEDGTRTRATEEQRQEQIRSSNESIQKYCG